MSRELERLGIPVAQLCTMVRVASAVGSNRIVQSRAVTSPAGDASLEPAGEHALRRQLLQHALETVCTPIDKPIVVVGR